MSRRARREVYALVRQARQQVEHAQEIQQQLESVLARIRMVRPKQPKARTKRKTKK